MAKEKLSDILNIQHGTLQTILLKLQELISFDPESYSQFFELLPESPGQCLLSCFKISLSQLAEKYDICRYILDKSHCHNGKYRYYLPDIALLCGRPLSLINKELQQIQRSERVRIKILDHSINFKCLSLLDEDLEQGLIGSVIEAMQKQDKSQIQKLDASYAAFFSFSLPSTQYMLKEHVLIKKHKRPNFDFDQFLARYFAIKDDNFEVLMDQCEDFDDILPIIYPEEEEVATIQEQFFQFLSREVSQDLDVYDNINYHELIDLYPQIAPKNMVKIFQGTSTKKTFWKDWKGNRFWSTYLDYDSYCLDTIATLSIAEYLKHEKEKQNLKKLKGKEYGNKKRKSKLIIEE